MRTIFLSMFLFLSLNADCIVLGDSIAVGTGKVLKECQTIGKVGINSKDFNKKYLNSLPSADNYIISLGANDYEQIKTIENVNKLRDKIGDKHVVWIIPYNQKRLISPLLKVVIDNNDDFVSVGGVSMEKDGIHPSYKGYKALGENIKALISF